MLNMLIPFVLRVRGRFPGFFGFLARMGKRYFRNRLGVYPRPLGHEIDAVASVINGSQWNMTSGKGLAHEDLEAAFADYVGVSHAIAVNTGGMAIQMSLRALGLRPGDEVLHQVDTCSATALAVMAAGCTPLFADISERTFMLSPDSVRNWVGPRTKAMIATHMWGNPENMPGMLEIADQHGIPLIEDACLSLGAKIGERMAGSYGRVAVFSFGCVKPIQGGEGGMIVTQDEALARELRSMRHWGDRSLEFGVRDTLSPAWNGRMSEIVAAVVKEQLKGYPAHLRGLREAVTDFQAFLKGIDGLDLAIGTAATVDACAFTQVVLRVDESRLGLSKADLMECLTRQGIPIWHANFELINSLSLFAKPGWENWMPNADLAKIRSNYEGFFPTAHQVYAHQGLGLGKMNFLSAPNLLHLKRQIEALSRRRHA